MRKRKGRKKAEGGGREKKGREVERERGREKQIDRPNQTKRKTE